MDGNLYIQEFNPIGLVSDGCICCSKKPSKLVGDYLAPKQLSLTIGEEVYECVMYRLCDACIEAKLSYTLEEILDRCDRVVRPEDIPLYMGEEEE